MGDARSGSVWAAGQLTGEGPREPLLGVEHEGQRHVDHRVAAVAQDQGRPAQAQGADVLEGVRPVTSLNRRVACQGEVPRRPGQLPQGDGLAQVGVDVVLHPLNRPHRLLHVSLTSLAQDSTRPGKALDRDCEHSITPSRLGQLDE